jgi:hypothetical protein
VATSADPSRLTAPTAGSAWIGSVLADFAADAAAARRAYAAFVRAGLSDAPVSRCADALGGLLVGSAAFVGRIRELPGARPADKALPQLAKLRPRPSLGAICAAVASHFGRAAESWAKGSRSDDASRAMAAYLARRRFGHTWRRVETCGSEQRPFIENLLMTKCALTPVPAPVSA